ncbi:glutathione S-transferase family protein [Ancylobacter amanitiformis]|uniref:Glutathione S-transferase n=1 Tax=Ancylobacter amanitiformis TaxID=217069 RepID=A0ABU0LQX4_9HYPH|nr:glutathione S-transferase family protein [Ancylobacter amanitiformis]MDQ0511105.1 glutathione S-transferase [Ancylobacter amanitiformis]
MPAPTAKSASATGPGTTRARTSRGSAAKGAAAKGAAAKGAAAASGPAAGPTASPATLTISSKNYSSWSLRGYLLCRLAGLDVEEVRLSADDPSIRAELLLQSSSFLVPRLDHDGLRVWDTLAIAEYLHELMPEAGLLPKDRATRSHCRSISGEMHSGFANLRSALPMNIKARHPGFKVWTGAQADIEHILTIWRDCLTTYGGPYLFGSAPTMADAMYAPVCSRFTTYDVTLDPLTRGYCEAILALPAMEAWSADAREEPDEMEELDVEF